MTCDHPTSMRGFFRNGPHVAERCLRCGVNVRGTRWVLHDELRHYGKTFETLDADPWSNAIGTTPVDQGDLFGQNVSGRGTK